MTTLLDYACLTTFLILFISRGIPTAIKEIPWQYSVYMMGLILLLDLTSWLLPAKASLISTLSGTLVCFAVLGVAHLCSARGVYKIAAGLIAVGGLSNMLVRSLNGFKMPFLNNPLIAEIAARYPNTYVLIGENTSLTYLADIIFWKWPCSASSIGDCLITIGLYVMLFKFLSR